MYALCTITISPHANVAHELHSSLNTILLVTLNKTFLKQSVRLLRNLNPKHQEKLQPIFIKLTNFSIKILLTVVSK